MAMLAMAAPVLGEGRQVLGHGRLVTNDLLVGNKDRWQSGSVAGSHVVGSGWAGYLPDRPFDILEYRIGAQVAAPENLRTPKATDRPFAGLFSVGLHTHFAKGATEFALGLDLVAVGPQTGLMDLQTGIHDALGVAAASKRVAQDQVKNDFFPTLVSEVAHPVAVGGNSVLRPYAEARVGVENILRVGADLSIGAVGQGELLVRDPVTGQRYRAISQQVPGFSYVLGGDVAKVDSSALLPEKNGLQLTETRSRYRAGVHWQGERRSVFYGVTYLSEEFKAQPEGQYVGSVRLKLKF
jgi:hypothetical protein